MINKDALEGKYIKTVDNTHRDLKCFQDFLYQSLNKHEQYENMHPKSDQHGRYFATAKTHEFDSINDVTLDQFKLHPIIAGTFFYNASKVVAKYLRSISKNKYSVDYTLPFLDFIKNAEELDDYEDVSYITKSLFTSIPHKESIDYII